MLTLFLKKRKLSPRGLFHQSNPIGWHWSMIWTQACLVSEPVLFSQSHVRLPSVEGYLDPEPSTGSRLPLRSASLGPHHAPWASQVNGATAFVHKGFPVSLGPTNFKVPVS